MFYLDSSGGYLYSRRGGNVVAQGANKNLSPTKKTCKRLDFTTCPRYTFTFKTLENCGQRDDYSRIEF